MKPDAERVSRAGRRGGDPFLGRAARTLEGVEPVPRCPRTPAALAAAAGELARGVAERVRRHATGCPACLEAYLAARAAGEAGGGANEPVAALGRRGSVAGREAVDEATAAWEAVFGSPWLRYVSAEAFRADVEAAGGGLELAPAGHWPEVPAGGPDWAGALLAARLPPVLEADSEAETAAWGLLVRAEGGRVRSIAPFSVAVTHRDRDERGLVVSGRLPPGRYPVDPAADVRCAWIASDGRLWSPMRFRLDRAEGFLVARFQAGAGPGGELRVLVLEPGD